MNFKNQVVSDIHQRIQKVISERDRLKENEAILHERIAALENEIQVEKSSFDALEQKYKVLKLAKSLEGEKTESGTDLKLKINEMVREIDKCIALLNK